MEKTWKSVEPSPKWLNQQICALTTDPVGHEVTLIHFLKTAGQTAFPEPGLNGTSDSVQKVLF